MKKFIFTSIFLLSSYSAYIYAQSLAAAVKDIPDCADSGSNHLNYNSATLVWSCGTSSGSGSGVGACGANTWASTLNAGTPPTCTQPGFSNLSGSIAASQLPNPSATTLGGIESIAAVSNKWINTISTSGVPNLTQPAFTDISGSVAAAQLPNPSSSTLGGIQSAAAVSNQWINSISTSGVPALSQPAFSNLSGSATVAQAGTGLLTTTTGSIITGGNGTANMVQLLDVAAGSVLISGGSATIPKYTAAGTADQVFRQPSVAGDAAWGTVDLSKAAAVTGTLAVGNGGTGLATHTTGAILTGGNGAANMVDLTDVAVGACLVSGGTSTIPAWRASSTCTSSSATTCTITSQRAGCLPVCSMSTSVSTTFRAALASTTITCTFGTSGTNTCNCHCF